MNNYLLKYMVILWCMLIYTTAFSSSHREAPLIASDPLADNVDLYAFRSPDDPNTVTLIATYVPLQLPHGGPNYYTFGENIRYEIHVDNDASIPGDEITYRFTFNIENEDPSTFFNIRLGAENQKATYTLERSMDGGNTFETIITNGVVPPNNIGDRSIGGMAGLGSSYEALWSSAITSASTGEVVFAGPTDDPFFVDLGGIFDLGDAPRQNGAPVDGLACYNVSALAIQVPISTLRKAGAPAEPTSILDPDYVIGVWASASRPSIRTLSTTSNPEYSGDWIQVSRLGMPLTNEAVIPIGSKDYWNAITPYDELAETDLDEFFYNPELALYMDDDQFGGAVPAFGPLRIQKSSLGMFDFSNGGDGVSALAGADLTGTAFEAFGDLLLLPGKPRSVDLWPIFHTGVPNAIPYQLATGKDGDPVAAGKPFIHNFLPNGGDMLRLNMAVPVTARDDANFSTLGLVQAAVLGLTAEPYNTSAALEFIPNMDGFPNGRRLEDDVTRIELQAVGGIVLAAVGLWYDDYDPSAGGSPVTTDLLDVLTYSTGVEQNDKSFTSAFPYLAMPHSGTGPCSGEIVPTTIMEDEVVSTFFVSSNTDSLLYVFQKLTDGTIAKQSFEVEANDADGIYYDEQNDVLYQLNRSDNVINAYSGVSNSIMSGEPLELTATSTSDFTNGREIAVSGNMLVVAQDASDANDMTNKLVTYQISPTEITFVKENISPINLWGLQFAGSDLIAIEDNSNRVAIFESFLTVDEGDIDVSTSITIDSLVRTHGITYWVQDDIMILTDVGEASSAEDGAYVVIENWQTAMMDGTISLDEQTKVAGSATFLGNPVDIAYDPTDQMIYVAERANDGGRVLGFDYASSGNAAPSYNSQVGGSSAIYLSGMVADTMIQAEMVSDFYVSSNTDSLVYVFQRLSDGSISTGTFEVMARDADGIYYDRDNDVLYQLNRTDNVINAYSNVQSTIMNGDALQLTATSSSDFVNGREIAVMGDMLVVAQDASDANDMTNKLVVYQISANAIDYVKEHTVDINLWGIQFMGSDLVAIVDNSNMVAIYSDFLSQADGAVTASQSIMVDGLVRTHGITYVMDQDMMILTDVGEASSAEDGAYFIIENFTASIADGVIAAEEQRVIAGDQTLLGNPVDIAYDPYDGMIFVAERANGGGRVLGFNFSDMGNIAPSFNMMVPGASAIYLDESDSTTTAVINTVEGSFEAIVYPNPTFSDLNLEFNGERKLYRNARVTIADLSGQIMHQQIIDNNRTVINTRNLSTGMYIITISGASFHKAMKFSKVE